MIINAICYKTKTPVIYSPRSQCDEFLACYGYEDEARTLEYIEQLNIIGSKEREAFFRMHYDIKEERVAYFFMHRQEEFEG